MSTATVSSTPAGARVEVNRGRRWSTVSVDRWPIGDATPAQQSAFRALARRWGEECIALGKQDGYSYGSGKTFQHLTVPAGREDEALADLVALEAEGAT